MQAFGSGLCRAAPAFLLLLMLRCIDVQQLLQLQQRGAHWLSGDVWQRRQRRLAPLLRGPCLCLCVCCCHVERLCCILILQAHCRTVNTTGTCATRQCTAAEGGGSA